MQFHLNGFKTGDPLIATHSTGNAEQLATPPAEVDVLIVGCGPAGLTLAAQLAAFPEISTCIVEKKGEALQLGQADGIACRTMEMFEAFDFSEKVLKEACWISEVTFWRPDDNAGGIRRHGRVQDTEDGLSEFPHVILNQARVHDFYLERMRNAVRPVRPYYSRRLFDLSVEDQTTDYPVTVRMRRTDQSAAEAIETVRARYVVGCDGARSAVREAIGRRLSGESANHAWGVMDILAITDFPDIRFKAAVQSEHGNLLVIPREGGFLVRLYVEMDKLLDNERVASRNITLDDLVAAARRILDPFTLEVKEVPWWSVYEIGQRICDRYDDVSLNAIDVRDPRVFIAGDACHTHSPKAGQGMNFSMQDSFNLGWKLAAILRGQAVPELLRTYSAERQPAAQELIDFDRAWARMFSDRARHDDAAGGGVDPAEFKAYFEQHGRFTAGVGTHYQPSIICGDATYQHLAKGFTIGTRFHSALVVRASDARPVHLGHAGKADGRWRLYAFADSGDDNRPGPRITELCRYLAESTTSPVRRYTLPGQDIDAVFDVRVIFQEPHDRLRLDGPIPTLMLPRKGRYSLYDYEKTFCRSVNCGDDIYDLRGLDRSHGVLVVVRPDQYVAHVLPLDRTQELAAFFNRFMVAPDGIV